MPDLKVANPIKDLPILERSRQEAFALVEVDPHLRSAENRPLREAVGERIGKEFGFINIS
jgi:ATP-dependent DNA helicase RecG